MNSIAVATLKKLKIVTQEVYLIAELLLPAKMQDGIILARLLKKLQKEKDALVKKLEKAKRDSK